MAIYTMAFELKKTRGEIEQMPASDMEEWRQFFEIRNSEMKKARRRG